jgi:hypothetical protein
MGRPLRVAPGGYVYHVLNRGNGRMRLFHKEADYQKRKGVRTLFLDKAEVIGCVEGSWDDHCAWPPAAMCTTC